MATGDEYVQMVQEAEKDGAHVAVLMYHRTAIEGIEYNTNAATVLLSAIQYAQRLKKGRDRKAVAQWGQDVMQRITPKTDLAEIICKEIAKLQAIGDKNAATP